jgi:hypothetical protein
MSDSTTQKISKITLERFRKFGRMGNSFDKVANLVLDKAEAKSSEAKSDE